jgi:uncharacterized membrane protein YkgB
LAVALFRRTPFRRPLLAKSSSAALVGRLGRSGLWLALGLLFLGGGLMLLTPYEAGAVRPLAASSPLLDWSYRLWGARGAGAVFGLLEIPIGLGLLTGLWRPGDWPAQLGAAGAVTASAITASFLLTAPGVVAGHTLLHLPLLSLSVGQLLAKDLVLLAASLTLLGESLGGGR